MASSQHPPDPRRAQRPPQQPALDDDLQVAPYLTHVVTHHGQLTLIPPQNAGRIRKSKSKKKRQPSARDRRIDDDEPRFTTAVPASSSRKLHPAPAHIRTRKHAISAPSPTTPTASRTLDSVPDDQSIPDYPPPSFEDAIASPHVPPHLASIPSSHSSTNVYNVPPSSTPLPSQHPYASHGPSASSATLLSSTTAYYDSPAVSQLSLARPTDPHFALEPQASVPTPAATSTTTLLSPTTVASGSTALSDMPLLRPPRPRSVQSSPLAQSNPRSTPLPGPIRLTSPSTTTLVSPATAVRDHPASPRVTVSDPENSLPLDPDLEEPESPLVEPLTPLSPSPHSRYRGSFSTVSDLVEELSLEPYQRWSADRRLGLSLEHRVQREFERRKAKEAKEASSIPTHHVEIHDASSSATPSGSMPNTPPASPGPFVHRRCSHCGSVRRRDGGDTQTIDEHSDEEDEDDDDEDDHAHFSSASRRSSPLPLPRGAGKSPYLHPAPTKAQMRARFGSHSPEPGSPASPLSPSMSVFKMPSAWASSVTLSLANALGSHKSTPSPSSSNSSTPATSPASGSGLGTGSSTTPSTTLKRRESFGVKRLFGSLKGKEREREREYAQLSQQVPPSSASSSESSVESVDGWEVVGGDNASAHSSSTGTAPTPVSPASPARLTPEASSPTSESARAAAGAFLNRPVRHRSPTHAHADNSMAAALPPAAPSPMPSSPPSPAPLSAAAARPYLPEKSPLRLIASANHLRQAHVQAQTLNSPVPASSPLTTTPRALRPSPSVIWKAPTNATVPGGQNSPVQRSPLSQSPYRPGAHSQLAQHHSQPHSQSPAPAQLQPQSQYRPPPPPAGPRASPAPTMSAPSSPSAAALRAAHAEPAPASPLTRSAPTLPEPIEHPNVPLRRRRAITPPPTHRRVPLACDTTTPVPPPPPPHIHTTTLRDEKVNGAIGEPSDVSESLSIEQLMDRPSSTPTSTPTPTTPSRAAFPPYAPSTPTRTYATPGSTPTTPTLGTPGSQHYRGRPLPQLPIERAESAGPAKRVSDGTPVHVNRAPELALTLTSGPDALPLPPPPPIDASDPPPQVLASSRINEVQGQVLPTPMPPPAHAPIASAVAMPLPSAPASDGMRATAPASTCAPVPTSASATLAPPLPMQMARSDSGDSVVEEARAAEEGPRPEFLEVTDLDLLAARLVEGGHDGRNYEDLLLVSEIIGPAPSATANTALAADAVVKTANEKATVPFLGAVEVERRRVLRDGRVKLKLSLLGVAVDRCGVCLSQFRRAERGALTPVCRHSFHEACLRRWLRTAGVCPICRMVLSMDD